MNQRCTAIVPFRPDTAGARAANLAAVLRWLTTMPVDVVVAHHGPAPAPDRSPSSTPRYVHVPSDGAFSKAAACNAGYVATSTPVIALVDADMLVDSRPFLGCVTRVLGGVDVIRPFGHLVDLDQATSQRVRDGAAPSEQHLAAPSPGREGEVIPICGGIVILRSDAFERAGGMDETFAGWGGEDDALSTALVRTGSDCRILSAERAYHLWHERDAVERYRHPRYDLNAERARWWRNASDADIARATEAGRRRLRADHG
jgi:N-terminal domain of galactosyltransferase